MCVGLEPQSEAIASLRALGSLEFCRQQSSPEGSRDKAEKCALTGGRQAGLWVTHASGLINWVSTIFSSVLFFVA